MKFTLTITDASIDELVAILTSPATPAALRNSAAAIVGTVASGNDDDESGDTPAVVGSVDGTGLPWDDRIHSTPAKQTNKGVWRAKRGVSDALVAQVEAELRARAPQPAPQMQQPAPVQQQYQPPAVQMQPVNIDPNFQPPQSVVIPQQQPAPVQQQYQPPVLQPAPQTQQPAPVQQYQPQQVQFTPGAIDFMTFMQHVMTISQSGKADANYFGDLANRVGAAFGVQLPGGITNFQQDQRMVDTAVQTMMNEGRWA